jgi:hypothetical protein
MALAEQSHESHRQHADRRRWYSEPETFIAVAALVDATENLVDGNATIIIGSRSRFYCLHARQSAGYPGEMTLLGLRLRWLAEPIRREAACRCAQKQQD